MENSLRDQLEFLSDSEKRELYAALALDYGRTDGKKVKFTDDEILIWDTINDVLGQRRQLIDVLSKASRPVQAYREDVEYALGCLDQGCRTPLTRTQRRALVREGIECLRSYIERGNAPLIHKTMIQQLGMLPEAVDRAFPGYMRAKLLDRIVPVAV